MCRFSNADDPNYRKVWGVLQQTYSTLTGTVEDRQTQDIGPQQSHPLPLHLVAFIGFLPFEDMNSRQQSIETPLDGTCEWLFENASYKDWWSRINMDHHRGFLWLKGKPGCGKSTLLNAAMKRIKLSQDLGDHIVASFFFNARGKDLEHNMSGMLRSLLYQLFRQAPSLLFQLNIQDELIENTESLEFRLSEDRLKSCFRRLFIKRIGTTASMDQLERRIILFVDALDECDQKHMREVAYLFADISESAYSSGMILNICISSRPFPDVTLTHCSEVSVHGHNQIDIDHYIDQSLAVAMNRGSIDFKILKGNILDKAAGVFLWVVLVVDMVLKDRDCGRSMSYLTKRIQMVPQALEGLFKELLTSPFEDDARLAVHFFQWVLLSRGPLRLREWHHILAFIRHKPPSSLREWKDSYILQRTTINLNVKFVPFLEA